MKSGSARSRRRLRGETVPTGLREHEPHQPLAERARHRDAADVLVNGALVARYLGGNALLLPVLLNRRAAARQRQRPRFVT
jgi:hypothetical protein